MELQLAPEMFGELQQAAKDCGISPRVFATEALESVLASRRLPRVDVGSHGPLMCGSRREAGHEDEDMASESAVCEHTILMPESEGA